MLLQQVVAILDAELERLGTLRTIVSGLSATGMDALEEQNRLTLASPVEAKVTAPQPVSPPERAISRGPKRQAAPRAVKAPKAKAALPSAPALRGSIPNAPVVVHRDALKTEHDRRQQVRKAAEESKSAPEFGSLGAMIRALRPERLA